MNAIRVAAERLRSMGMYALSGQVDEEADALRERVRTLEDALRPFALFAEKLDTTPIRGIADTLYAIHAEERAAELRLSDCRNARKALLGEGK